MFVHIILSLYTSKRENSSSFPGSRVVNEKVIVAAENTDPLKYELFLVTFAQVTTC